MITLQKTYELVTGRTPFEAGFDDRALIPQFQKVIGSLPERWIHEALSSGVLKEPPDSPSSLTIPNYTTASVTANIQKVHPQRIFCRSRKKYEDLTLIAMRIIPFNWAKRRLKCWGAIFESSW